ncbi:MAG TPA: DUF485 domain-containing protein [Verrucomicrobiae bacterium]|nr:DUF485 domain-containing protein [Verrucomicrobiae bacterium]
MKWDKIAQGDDFKNLISAKAKFLIPAIIFSLVFYFALPLSVGYLPVMKTKVFGSINIAYLFALSQFFVAWGIAAVYARVANRSFDPLAEKIRKDNAGGM